VHEIVFTLGSVQFSLMPDTVQDLIPLKIRKSANLRFCGLLLYLWSQHISFYFGITVLLIIKYRSNLIVTIVGDSIQELYPFEIGKSSKFKFAMVFFIFYSAETF
jgi:hypothetical protein